MAGHQTAHIALFAMQPCPAALPSWLARQPCPAGLLGSLARQPCRNIGLNNRP
jgi:hypothetical protein